MSNSTTIPFVPKLFTPLSVLSILMSATIIGLAVVNFGFLSIWLNMSIAILTIIFHVTSLFLVWRERQRALAESSLTFTPSLTSVSSIGEKTPSSIIMEYQKHTPQELPVASTGTSFGLLIFLFVVYTVAFLVTISITLNGGVKSTLPSERAKGMTRPWNIHVQIAQSAMLGAESLLMAVIVVLCVMARRKFSKQERERSDEVDYGMAAPAKLMYPVAV